MLTLPRKTTEIDKEDHPAISSSTKAGEEEEMVASRDPLPINQVLDVDEGSHTKLLP